MLALCPPLKEEQGAPPYFIWDPTTLVLDVRLQLQHHEGPPQPAQHSASRPCTSDTPPSPLSHQPWDEPERFPAVAGRGHD